MKTPFQIPGLRFNTSGQQQQQQQSPPPGDDVDPDKGQQRQQQQQSDDVDDSDVEITDPKAFLSALMTASDDDDDDSSDDNTADSSKKKKGNAEDDPQAAAAAEILQNTENLIKNFTMPDEFDYSHLASADPKEQKNAVRAIAQQTIQTAMEAILPIMQQISTQMETDFSGRLDERFQNLSSTMERQSSLLDTIPQYKDKALRPMIERMDRQLEKAGQKNPSQRAKNIKKLMEALPLGTSDSDDDDRSQSTGGGNQQRQRKTDLTSYFGIS